MRIKFATVIFVLLSPFVLETAHARVESVNVGNGTFVRGEKHWIRVEPKNPPLRFSLAFHNASAKSEDESYVEIRIDNLTSDTQKVDFANIQLQIMKNGKNFKLHIKLDERKRWKLKLKRYAFVGQKLSLRELQIPQEEGAYLLWGYYELPETGREPPDDRAINSNDLEIVIK